MNWTRADALAMRRRLLVIDASIQRLRLRNELAATAGEARPAALARRALASVRDKPSSFAFALPVIAAALLRGRTGRAFAVSAIRLWRTWRAWQRQAQP